MEIASRCPWPCHTSDLRQWLPGKALAVAGSLLELVGPYCNKFDLQLHLRVAARTIIVIADQSLRYTSMLLGR